MILCNASVDIDMQKPNKINVVTTARFDEISKQVKHSIELATHLSNSFKFSESTPDDLLSPNNLVSVGISNFDFREPLERVSDEQQDTVEELVEFLPLLNICHSDESSVQLDCSIQRDDDKIENCHVDQSSIQFDSSMQLDDDNIVVCHSNHSTIPLDCSIQQAGDNNAVCHSNHSSFQLDCSIQREVDCNDNIQTDGGKSAGIDPNTQITHLDIDNNEQNPPSRKQHDNQPALFLVKHILNITWPNQEKVCYVPVMQLFGQTFDAVMIYGIVTSLCIENGGLVQRFVIDDGSGSINVVWKADAPIIGEFLKQLRCYGYYHSFKFQSS